MRRTAPGLPRSLLRKRKRCDNLIVFRVRRWRECRQTRCVTARQLRSACPAFGFQIRREALAEQDIVRNHRRATDPCTFHQGCVMRTPVVEIILAKSKWLGKVSAQQRHVLAIAKLGDVTGSMGAETHNVVAPERAIEFWADRPHRGKRRRLVASG